SDNAAQGLPAHEPFYGTSGDRNGLTIHLLPDLISAVHLHVGLPNTLDMRHKHVIALRTRTAKGRITRLRRMTPVSRRGDLQNLADRLDPKLIAMPIDKGSQDLKRRSSSAWAKNALASFRISLARRSSLTSRSRSLTRCASAVETPGRSPASTSARFTHSSSVCGTQPILGAIDSTAAQSDGYSPRCSCTIRTARSRTSGENFFDLFMGSILSEVGASTKPGAIQHASASRSVRR